MVTIIKGRSNPQETFGEMLRVCFERSKPEAFHGDLWHDAVWLKTNFDEAKENGGFFWSLGNCGTHLNLDRQYVDHGGTEQIVYFVKLENA